MAPVDTFEWSHEAR